MDFSLRAFAQAFEETYTESQNKKFPVYAFILATPSDKNVFPELLTYLPELHKLTADVVLVIAPRIKMFKSQNKPMTALEISEVLAKKEFFDNHTSTNQYQVFWQIPTHDQEGDIRNIHRAAKNKQSRLESTFGDEPSAQ